MKRVALASYDLVPSPKGAAQHILANAHNLQDQYDISLITLGQKPLYGWRHLPIDISVPNWLNRGKEFYTRCRHIFEKNPFDIYHVRSPWEGLAVPDGKPLIYEVNGLASIEMPYHYPNMIEHPLLRTKLRNMELALLSKSTRIIVTNPITESYLLDIGVSAQKIRMVPNTPSFPLVDLQQKMKHAPARICYIGTLTRWQGVYNAIRALERIETFDFRVRMLCTSKGRKTFEKWVKKRAVGEKIRIEDPLPKDKLQEFLQTQDIGLAPLTPCSRNLIQGCMPIKILDYMAAGLSVVTSDSPVSRYILGEEGYFYRPYSTDSFTQALTNAVQASSTEKCQKNQIRIHSYFSRAKQREALLRVYEEII
jgi:glycosyltransferase involved in cell wall biosynthesis